MAFEDESLYAVIAIPVIFLLGLAGVAIPSIIAVVFPKYGITRKLYFSFFNGLAGGLILAVGLIHSLPEAIEGLESVMEDSDASEETKGYPWAIWIALMAIIIMFAVEELLDVISHRFGIESFDGHSHGSAGGHEHHAHEEHACDHTKEEHKAMDGACDAQPLEEECTHGLSKVASDSDSDLEAGDKKEESVGGTCSTDDSCAVTKKEEELEAPVVKPPAIELFMKMVVLFIGLFFHNIFVGLALGIADNDYVLFIALLFHQFFEGLGMGARVAMTKMRRAFVVVIIDLAFAATPSIFIGIGIGIKNGVAEADSTSGYNGVKGTLQALSAGMLIYIALLHMLRGYKELGLSGKRLDLHRLMSFLGLCLGAGIMSVIGIWA